MRKCCFYGSLRKPMYNYERFVIRYGIDSFKHMKTIKLKGFKLYDLNGSYPCATESFDNSEIIADLFNLSDVAYKSIKSMEQGAGYYEHSINIDDNMYVIYLMKENLISPETLIKSGDWITYYNNKKIINDDMV